MAVEGEAGAVEDLEYLEREKWLDRAEIQYPRPPSPFYIQKASNRLKNPMPPIFPGLIRSTLNEKSQPLPTNKDSIKSMST